MHLSEGDVAFSNHEITVQEKNGTQAKFKVIAQFIFKDNRILSCDPDREPLGPFHGHGRKTWGDGAFASTPGGSRILIGQLPTFPET